MLDAPALKLLLLAECGVPEGSPLAMRTLSELRCLILLAAKLVRDQAEVHPELDQKRALVNRIKDLFPDANLSDESAKLLGESGLGAPSGCPCLAQHAMRLRDQHMLVFT